jgi:competence protein ComFC
MFGVLDSQGHFDTVVPGPLHRSPLMRRGFNQVELLARGVAREIKAPVADTIQVARRARDQVELSAAERWINVWGAFRAKDHICGTVLLVDDVVFTTGATMSACAETLLPAGAVEVHALSLCRTC